MSGQYISMEQEKSVRMRRNLFIALAFIVGFMLGLIYMDWTHSHIKTVQADRLRDTIKIIEKQTDTLTKTVVKMKDRLIYRDSLRHIVKTNNVFDTVYASSDTLYAEIVKRDSVITLQDSVILLKSKEITLYKETDSLSLITIKKTQESLDRSRTANKVWKGISIGLGLTVILLLL